MEKLKYVLLSLALIPPILGFKMPQEAFELSGVSNHSVELQSVPRIEYSQPRAIVSVPVTKTYETSEIIQGLIKCESGGRNVQIIDSNGLWSRGILQYQDGTWNWFSKMSGITGSPLIKEDAIRMTEWAIQNGYLKHWSCAKILGYL